MIGKILGHYQITKQLGKGGMGEVYRAKDEKLGREVAIKVLPEEFAKDTDSVARFQREAKLLASLNHPNIASIYGLEESSGTNFLVLELVEGETLAERIKAGPVPVEESLKLALQIAEALEAAHEKGVIHRDLKPANIKVTPDGKVKVLDFGLAKAFAGDQEVNLSNSPTLSDAATRQGVILGTAAYMSPEQARGKPVDKRTDIWAFGCVLCEMLTGQAAFQGEDVTEILATVVKGGADLDLLPANIHPRVREVIIRCLQKDLRRRYSGITDALYDIGQALADPKGVFVQPMTAAETHRKLRAVFAWITALILVAIITGVAVWNLRKPEPPQVMRFDYDLPEGQQLSDLSVPMLAVSPDGKQIVYSTTRGLHLRSMNELTAKLIAGTEGETMQPFFSPDSRWIGYFSVRDQKLKKIGPSGGTPVILCDAATLTGASWSADDTIAYSLFQGKMMRISADGGTPEFLIDTKAGSGRPSLPQVLPDGKSVLYTNTRYEGVATSETVMLKSPELREPKPLFAGSNARYLPTGHIVYEVSNSLFARPFDPGRREVYGKAVLLIEGAKQAAISSAGTLVYMPQAASALPESGRILVWVDRNGREESLAAPPNHYYTPKISPDGKRVAMGIRTEKGTDIHIWDLVGKTLTQLTFDGRNVEPLWTRDSKRIAFFSMEPGADGTVGRVYWKAADGTGQNEPLSSKLDRTFFPGGWSSDAKILVGTEMSQDVGRFDLGMLSMEGDHELKPLLQTDYFEQEATISRDGRWMAYDSNESGSGIYVCPFPDVTKGRWRISTGGGSSPLWSSDGRELFFLGADGAAMAVSIKTDPSFSKVGEPAILFRGTYVQGSGEYPPWDISPDGKRFLMIKRIPSKGDASATEAPGKIVIVLNWLEELKQRVSVK